MFSLAFVLFVSGIQKISTDLYEAAQLDGAGPVQEFFAVTLPGLRGELRVALVLMITAALRNFDIVWNTTAGGPAPAPPSRPTTCTATRSSPVRSAGPAPSRC